MALVEYSATGGMDVVGCFQCGLLPFPESPRHPAAGACTSSVGIEDASSVHDLKEHTRKQKNTTWSFIANDPILKETAFLKTS